MSINLIAYPSWRITLDVRRCYAELRATALTNISVDYAQGFCFLAFCNEWILTGSSLGKN